MSHFFFHSVSIFEISSLTISSKKREKMEIFDISIVNEFILHSSIFGISSLGISSWMRDNNYVYHNDQFTIHSFGHSSSIFDLLSLGNIYIFGYSYLGLVRWECKIHRKSVIKMNIYDNDHCRPFSACHLFSVFHSKIVTKMDICDNDLSPLNSSSTLAIHLCPFYCKSKTKKDIYDNHFSSLHLFSIFGISSLAILLGMRKKQIHIYDIFRFSNNLFFLWPSPIFALSSVLISASSYS